MMYYKCKDFGDIYALTSNGKVLLLEMYAFKINKDSITLKVKVKHPQWEDCSDMWSMRNIQHDFAQSFELITDDTVIDGLPPIPRELQE